MVWFMENYTALKQQAIVLAYKENFIIEGKDPIVWAVENKQENILTA